MNLADIKNNPHLNKLLEKCQENNSHQDKPSIIIDSFENVECLILSEKGFSLVKDGMIINIKPSETNITINNQTIDCESIFNIFHDNRKESRDIIFELDPSFNGQAIIDPISLQINDPTRLIPTSYFLTYKFSISLLFSSTAFEEKLIELSSKDAKKIFKIDDFNSGDKIILNHNGFIAHIDGLDYFLHPQHYNIQIKNKEIINCQTIFDLYKKIDPDYKSPITFINGDLILGQANIMHSILNPKGEIDNYTYWFGATLSIDCLWDLDNLLFIYAHEVGHLKFRLEPHSFLTNKLLPKVDTFFKVLSVSFYMICALFTSRFIYVALSTNLFKQKGGFVFFLICAFISLFALLFAYMFQEEKPYKRMICHYTEFWCDSWAYDNVKNDLTDIKNLFMFIRPHNNSKSHPSSYRRIINLHKKVKRRNNPFFIFEFDLFPKKLNDKINEWL